MANDIAALITDGLYKTGERLPSVRAQSRQRTVSVSTAVAAFRLLENWGYVEARARGVLCKTPGELSHQRAHHVQPG
ncbi:MAG: GntR family transcriptional regulator [Pseudomonadales bacterium]|nr:GntR family transcriptional regulator [Pseudomonadales bacterium]